MIDRYRHAQLLFMLVVLLLLSPFIQHTIVFAVVDLMLVLTLVSAVVACADKRRDAIGGVIIAGLVLAASVYRDLSGIEAVTVLYSALGMLFFGYTTWMVLWDVFRTQHAVSLDTICAGLAVYLLLGVGWAFAYALMESVVPGSFQGLHVEGYGRDYQRFLGYSFVTMTTLGYGNVWPANARAEALASGQAVVGQVYLTVLIARLVALHLAFERSAAEHPDDDGQKQT